MKSLNAALLQVALCALMCFTQSLFAVDPPPIDLGGTPMLTSNFFKGKTAPERIKITEPVAEPVVDPNYVGLADNVPDLAVMRRSYPVRTSFAYPDGANFEALRKIRAGEYDSAIRELQETLNAFTPWWEERVWHDEQYPATIPAISVPINMYLLATAYELNGDWGDMLNANAVIYGGKSEEYSWARIRATYASTPDFEGPGMLRMLSREAKKLPQQSLDEVLKTVESSRISDDASMFRATESWKPTAAWKAFYTFYENCARVVCPEIYFVTKYRGSSTSERNYFELQKESFGAFVDVMEKQYQGLPSGSDSESEFAQTIELLRKLRDNNIVPQIIHNER